MKVAPLFLTLFLFSAPARADTVSIDADVKKMTMAFQCPLNPEAVRLQLYVEVNATPVTIAASRFPSDDAAAHLDDHKNVVVRFYQGADFPDLKDLAIGQVAGEPPNIICSHNPAYSGEVEVTPISTVHLRAGERSCHVGGGLDVPAFTYYSYANMTVKTQDGQSHMREDAARHTVGFFSCFFEHF